MKEKKKLSLPAWIFIGMLAGIVAGLIFAFAGLGDFTTEWIKPVGTIYVNLLKFLVVPVVLFSIADGVISLKDLKRVGSVGVKTVVYYMCTTALAVVIGLPLGVLLVAGEKGGVLPLPKALMSILNVIINLLRSIPFLILMIMVFPLSRLIIGTTVGTTATIVPLVVAAFPFVARLVESSLREVDPNIIEAAQSMGATPMQIICKVMIPESIPSLLQNFTIALTTILGYSAMSGIIGGGGLGKIAIDYGFYRYKYLVMYVAVILLILLVQLFQSVGTKLAAKCDKRLKNR